MDHHFWEALCVILFVGLFYKPVKNMIGSQLDAYSKDIAVKVKEAEDLEKDAQETLDEYKKLHKEFVKKSQLIAETSKENIARIAEDAAHKLKESIKIQKSLHKERLLIYEVDTLNEVRRKAVIRAFSIAQTYFKENSLDLSSKSIRESLNSLKIDKSILN
ncbi:MAG: hypothetical protein RLN62_06915 [Rickettsiales bacterium]